MQKDMKTVQTSLTKEEYQSLKEAFAKKRLTIHDGLRKAALKVITEELRIDPDDPFFKRKAVARSGLGDLSARHERYLYEKKR